ncbi:acyltransferase family protein [Nonomuraea indica]|uniref:acyltransferase family protein n=1 Tax=Nonomuraea indica TaxID=1581193 RepID=UPI0015DDC134|nr:acyltransferase family protein [Nonomuraea indica]
MSDHKHSSPVTSPPSAGGPGDGAGPAHTGSRWPLPEERFWSEQTDPHVALPPDPHAPGETAPQPLPQAPAPQPHSAQVPAPQPHPAQVPAPQRHPAQEPAPQPHPAQPPAPQPHPAQPPAPQPHPAQVPAFQRVAGPQAPAGPGPQPGGGPRAAVAVAEPPHEEQKAAEQAPPPRRKRDPYLDNVKFVLIALVVIGHSLVPTLDADSSRAAYIFIYVFHMPLFVLISGYLSRNFWNSNAKTNKLVDTFVVPYVIVEVGYAALRFALGQKWSLTIIDPAWLNWYLLALLFWRLSTPVWKRMKHPVPVAIAIYLFAGFSQISGDFSMDRFFGLLPFFVIGLVMQPEHFEMLDRRWIKIVSVVTVLAAAAVAVLIASRAKLAPFYFKNSYQDMDLSWYMGIGLRTGLLVCSLALCFAVLALVPRTETWYSDLGTRTLYCYLLHGVPVLIAKEMGWLSQPWLFGPLGVLAISSSCFALAIVLCLPETRTVFKWLLEPRLTWLYRRPSGS